MRHWRTTGNSNVVIQTGSTCLHQYYIITNPTAKCGFLPRQARRKCRQDWHRTTTGPEIEIRPPNPEIVTTGNMYNIASEFQWQVRNFLPWRAKCLWQCPTIGNGNAEAKTGNTYNSQLWQIGWQFQRKIWGFRSRPAAQLEETDPERSSDCDKHSGRDRQPEMVI